MSYLHFLEKFQNNKSKAMHASYMSSNVQSQNLNKTVMKNVLRFALLIVSLFQGIAANAQTVDPEALDGVIYVKVRNESSIDLTAYAQADQQMRKMVSQYGITKVAVPFKTKNAGLQKVYKISFTNFAQVNALIKDLYQFSFLEYAEKAPIYQLSDTPNDFASSQQWSLEKINAAQAWNVAEGSSTIKVAIVDNAILASHEDLITNRWTNPLEIPNNHSDDDGNGFVDDIYGYDVADMDKNPEPPANALNTGNFTHGTHCAGIAAGTTGNGIGISSIGNGIQFISVKCTPDSYTTNTLTESYAGVDYAIAAGADIISMSFGGTHNYQTWDILIQAAQEEGILMVAAAGNSNNETVFYPAGYSYVIAVGSTALHDDKSSFSNFGEWVDVMAPGSGIYSTLPENGDTYGNLSGTSMACPMVAGLAGLLKSTDPTMTVQKLKGLIFGGCDNINGENEAYIGKVGAGRINAFRSMENAILGVETLTKAENLKLYPNPNKGNFTIQAENGMEGEANLSVFNALGQAVYQQDIALFQAAQAVPVAIDGLNKGFYTIRLVSNNRMQHASLVIE